MLECNVKLQIKSSETAKPQKVIVDSDGSDRGFDSMKLDTASFKALISAVFRPGVVEA